MVEEPTENKKAAEACINLVKNTIYKSLNRLKKDPKGS